ncbi:ATP-binding protein [Natronomonas sp. CBA1123]|uniref:ATP-binding protein n=1 Tax=Natronomonas sp. CBA1123 TaxID=2668070 RepID=UPI0012EA6840|nr:ATP-binding protein [Natronomonas sp. CBA1123]MUV85161.1 ATP-binding protein [Natronomonas sp. CBA1123]
MLGTPPLTQSRTYLEIRPADEPLKADTVTRSITDLHRSVGDSGLLGGTEYPTYEMLIAATGTTGDTGQRSLAWYVGVDTPEHLDATRRALTACLPHSYDIVKTDCTYADLLNLPEVGDDTSTDADTLATDGTLTAEGSIADSNHRTTDDPAETAPLADWDVAAVDYHGVGDRPRDWQCPMKPIEEFVGADESTADWPLSRVFNALATGDAPALVQFIIQPKPDWTADRDDRIFELENGTDLYRYLIGKWIADFFTGTHDRERSSHNETTPRRDRYDTHASGTRHDSGYGSSPTQSSPDLQPSETRRIEALNAVDTRQSFTVNARAVALDTDPDPADATCRPLVDAFQPLTGAHYCIEGRRYSYGSKAANDVFEALLDRTLQTNPERRRHIVPGIPNRSPAIVVGPAALGGLCLTGGPALESDARRALETTPRERTGLELPPRAVLNRYLEAEGMHIGHPCTADREPLNATVSLPPTVQQLHTAITGQSGTGKSALGHGMLAGNFEATDGANIYIDSKGDGGPDAYLRAHYARHGDLDDVYYFDCAELLPGLPLLSIKPQLDADIDRVQAVENVADRHLEILAGYMGQETFHSAPMAVDVVEALIKALFDPVHGSDTISQTALLQAAARMHRSGEAPPVSDPHLRETLDDVTANSDRVFDNIMGAAGRRIRQASKDARLAPLFTHTDGTDAAFDLRDHLDEQCVIIFDTSGYRDDPRSLLTLAIISELWTALTRRAEDADPHDDLPQVNLFLEEAADIAASELLTDLLSQGRAFGVGVTVMLQFPEQLRDDYPRVYRELINDIGTHITGPVNDATGLARAFATDAHPVDDIATRISNLERGDWLVNPAAPFADTPPTPFYCQSRSLPPGHPDGEDPLDETTNTSYDAQRTLLETRMYRKYGLAIAEHTITTSESEAIESTPTDGESTPDTTPLHTTIPHTNRLPDCLTYVDDPPYPLVCTACERRYAPSTEGLRNAIQCCHELAAIDRADIPITTLDVPLTASDRRRSPLSDAQLRFLAAIYMAHQQRFDPDIEFDIVRDSMVRLQEYVGIDSDAVRDLIDDGLLKRDCTHPHYLYTVTPDGRDALEIEHREGIAHGDGKGDLSESSLHVALVEAGYRFLTQAYVDTPDSPAVEATRYLDVEGGRLDAAALDADDNVVVTLEAELSNNDTRRAVPSDFDTMAACDPNASIWVVKNRDGAHEVLQALNDPAEGDPRVQKTYSENMRPQDFTIDTAGLTDVYTFQTIRNQLTTE